MIKTSSTNDALAVEHEIQRLMLERLGIEWTPGEPFYSLVEAEIERLEELNLTQARRIASDYAEIERLRAEIETLRKVIRSAPQYDIPR